MAFEKIKRLQALARGESDLTDLAREIDRHKRLGKIDDAAARTAHEVVDLLQRAREPYTGFQLSLATPFSDTGELSDDAARQLADGLLLKSFGPPATRPVTLPKPQRGLM
jgi:hypothetical protein